MIIDILHDVFGDDEFGDDEWDGYVHRVVRNQAENTSRNPFYSLNNVNPDAVAALLGIDDSDESLGRSQPDPWQLLEQDRHQD